MEPILASLSNSDNQAVTLGMIAEKLNQMDEHNKDCWEHNDREHQLFKSRLDEGDKYLLVFRVSRCAFSWLDRNGAIKWFLILLAFWAIDYFNRAWFWSQRGIV